MLGNIHPKYRSNLHVIQLVAAVETWILQKHSIQKILEPFMSDIKALETVSIYAHIAIAQMTIQCHRVLVCHLSLMGKLNI